MRCLWSWCSIRSKTHAKPTGSHFFSRLARPSAVSTQVRPATSVHSSHLLRPKPLLQDRWSPGFSFFSTKYVIMPIDTTELKKVPTTDHLRRLRALMLDPRYNLTAYVIPSEDAHQVSWCYSICNI
jgi:hypothetical protein